jgi:alpha-amylase
VNIDFNPDNHDLVIAHLFDWPFARARHALPSLVEAGFNAVQVSPPQASIDRPDWWARYQPIDHTRIEGPLGSEVEFRAMIAEAHRQQPPVKVIVDVVLNHMAEVAPTNEPLVYPRFGPEHFHPRAAIDWNSIDSIRTGWIGHGPDLPDLRTEHAHVRAEARRYLERLIECGADGFRFDAVKHIEPEFFDEVLRGLPSGLVRYGEYISQPGHGPVMREYLRTMRLMDFGWLATLAAVLDGARPMSALVCGDEDSERLAPEHAVAFATNHDIELDQYGGFHLPQGAMALANAMALTRPGAWPLVWAEHLDDPVVLASLRLRRLARGRPPLPLCVESNWAVWRFGEGALLLANASRCPVTASLDEWLPSAAGWCDLVTGKRLPARFEVSERTPVLVDTCS